MLEGFGFLLLVFGVPVLLLGFVGMLGHHPGERSDVDY